MLLPCLNVYVKDYIKFCCFLNCLSHFKLLIRHINYFFVVNDKLDKTLNILHLIYLF